MNIRYPVFLSICLAVILNLGIAQTPDTAIHRNDSLLRVKLNEQFDKVQQLSAERFADSLKRADLEKRVANFTESDQQQKSILLKELAGLQGLDSLKKIKQLQQVDSLRKIVKGYPVRLFRDTLFTVFTRQGSFLPKDRAEEISKRLLRLSNDFAFHGDSMKLLPSEQAVDIVYKDVLVMSVSDQDALWANSTREELAHNLRAAIITGITHYQEETSWQTLLKEGLLALLVLLVVALFIYGINHLFKWMVAKTVTQKAWYSRGIRLRNYEVLNTEQQLKVLHWIFRLFKWMIIILIIYLALPVLFGIFPFTKDVSNLLIGYIVSPLKKIAGAVYHYIPNLVTIIVVVVIFRYVLKFFHFLKNEISGGRLTIPGFYADWANPTYQILRVLVLAFLLVVIFPYMPGSDSGIFKGVSVFIGVLFTFGSAGALGNVVAGLVLTYMRAFKIGDRVKIGEVTGDVIDKSLLVTRIRTIQNEIISIPNSTVMSNHTVNYSSDAAVNGLIIHTTVTIGYDVPWRQVHELLINAALETPMIEQQPGPYVLQTSLDDYYVSYRLNAYTKEPNRQAVIYSHLHANIQDKFNEAGVEIMSPHYNALRDGNMTTIPADYLPKDYQQPPFHFRKQE